VPLVAAVSISLLGAAFRNAHYNLCYIHALLFVCIRVFFCIVLACSAEWFLTVVAEGTCTKHTARDLLGTLVQTSQSMEQDRKQLHQAYRFEIFVHSVLLGVLVQTS
jgi:hypothetical protein